MKKLVRLDSYEIKSIKETILEFDENSEIYIFGSRTDLSKKGGDIDVFVKSSLTKDQIFDFKLNVLTGLEKKLGERKIDLIVKLMDSDDDLIIYEHAEKTGIKI